MKTNPLFMRAVLGGWALVLGTTASVAAGGWDSRVLMDEFYAEGASAGDLDGDGVTDLAYGPFWYSGPDFSERKRFAPGDPFEPDEGYSDNFFSFVHDVTGDGENDVVVFGFPGKEVRLYVNPGEGKRGEAWPMHQIADNLANESPHFVDLKPGGLPEMVGARDGVYGYYEAGADATKPWVWRGISAKGEAKTPFGHGLGVGDVNGDGRLDVVEMMFWYEQPEGDDGATAWKKHRWALTPYGRGGAQILVDDVDGDGDADLITSLNAHGRGLAWFEQTTPNRFARHNIMGNSSTENAYGVAFSQLHAMALGDMDGDGRNDFVTGKRWMAHKGKDPGAFEPAVLYWFRNTVGADGVEFVPELIHDDFGVGTEVMVTDLNGDGRLDVLSGSKKGLSVHMQGEGATAIRAEQWKAEGGRPQNGYGKDLSAEAALARMDVPEGFAVDLIAAEPDVVQPIAMCFDARGRIWVIEGNTYPQRAPEGQGKDRILIFEDGDGDGSFETRKVFAEHINLASGIEVGFGGVFVGAAPNLLFFADADGDDVPDGYPEILLDGWAWQDTHETLNAFTWGPDGWLYGCHGVFTHSNVGMPGASPEERQPINAGVWRYHPVTRDFEVFAWGSSNPWGVDFDEHGEWFITACVIPHLYHLSQGGRYFRQAGQHFNPYVFDDIRTIADHVHYGDGTFGSMKGDGKVDRQLSAAKAADTSAVGGGHAHCGLTIYQADEFPEAYRGDLLFHNLHGHRVVRERLEREGSGFVGRHRPDFMFSNDHEHVGVTVMQGPDGALYTSDWNDSQTCHHRDVEIWDRSNGRIYRVRHGEAKSTVTNLVERDVEGLVAALGHGNAFWARQGQRLLQERAAAGELDGGKLLEALRAFEKEHADEVPLRLRAFWTAHACGLLTTEDLAARLDDESEYMRGWAVQFLGEKREALSAEVLARVERLAAEERSPVTRRYVASLLQRLPFEQRWEIAAGLMGHAEDHYDRNIPLLTWYGVEPLVPVDPDRAFELADGTTWPRMREYIGRRAAATAEGREALLTSLSKAKTADDYVLRAGQLLLALHHLPPVERPASWVAARERGEALKAKAPAVADVMSRMGVRFGDADYYPKWRGMARNAKASRPERVKALELLTAGGDPELGVLARDLIDDGAVRAAAVKALRESPGVETAEVLVSRLGEFPLALRNEAINLVAARPESALVLLRAVDEKEVEASLVSPVMLDQFERFGDGAIDELIERNWVRGAGGVDLAQLAEAIEKWEKKLHPKLMARADASRGRQVYQMTCGTCHKLFGEGIDLGPDLTGSNRADLAYVLENVLAPSAVVGKDYMLNIFTLKDGSVVSGMVRESQPDFFKVAMPGGTLTDVKLVEVSERQEIPQSLMPAGLFEALPLEQVADLVKYLASPAQVALPGPGGQAVVKKAGVPVPAKKPGLPPLGPPKQGVTRVEGEGLLEGAEVTGGRLREQMMGRFLAGRWSGDAQLWWTGGKPGDVLTLTVPDLAPGNHALSVHPTTAGDYAQMRVMVNGHVREVDLFTPRVLAGEPVTFEGVNVSPTEPLKVRFEITGANDKAKRAYMVGIDRVEVEKAK
ncbi:MAG: PVC-type heme-binding CxxCH protein [Verrucomicrobiota bacterium]